MVATNATAFNSQSNMKTNSARLGTRGVYVMLQPPVLSCDADGQNKRGLDVPTNELQLRTNNNGHERTQEIRNLFDFMAT